MVLVVYLYDTVLAEMFSLIKKKKKTTAADTYRVCAKHIISFYLNKYLLK